MHLGFSYIGLVFLLLLMVPNLLWTNQQPAGYEDYVNHESKVLLAFERIGEAAVTVLVLIFRDFNLSPLSPWSLWLAGAFLLMAIYGRNPLLFAADVILGIGHIGIHLGHRKEIM